MNTIVFDVQGEPKGQPRPRAFAMKTKTGTQVRVYDPGTAENWKSAIAEAARPYIPPTPLEGAVTLDVTLFMPRPLGHFIGRQRARGLKADAPKMHTSKPDCDNTLKPIADALTRLRFWHDDSQIAAARIVKLYEDPGSGPGANIRVGWPT